MIVKIKHSLIIFERPSEWEEISARLVKDYGPSILISWKCKRELGFTVRHHQGLQPYDTSGSHRHDKGSEYVNLKGRYYYSPEVHLDFYSEAAQSFFVLKYLNLDG
jgi:hypothetical protein